VRDYFGNELAVGDTVAFCEPGYRNLITGQILNFTPQKVRVKYLSMGIGLTPTTYLGEPNFFIKKTPPSDRDIRGKEAW
jgi:hypothetical protein